MMKLEISKQAEKFWNDLPPKQFRQVGRTVVGLLKEPRPHDSADLKGAKNGERRVDIGEYRVIYTVLADVVSVLVIGLRNDDDVYKIWERSR
jgi:mRNA interferase RelE/StbE